MIQGVTHVGITVQDIEHSIAAFSSGLGLEVVSDAPRSGELSDQVYQTKDSCARVVYLAVSPFQHIELFHFTNPKTTQPCSHGNTPYGVYYCALQFQHNVRLSQFEPVEPPSWLSPVLSDEAHQFESYGLQTIKDADGCLFRVYYYLNEDRIASLRKNDKMLYPAVIVSNLAESLHFYRDVMGLEVWHEGIFQSDIQSLNVSSNGIKNRYAVLESPWGLSMMLIQHPVSEITPAAGNVWQKPGFTHITFAVKELESFYDNLTRNDVNLWFAPKDLGVGPHAGGKLVFLTTPDGVVVELIDSPLTRQYTV